jgi:hypothetical protein
MSGDTQCHNCVKLAIEALTCSMSGDTQCHNCVKLAIEALTCSMSGDTQCLIQYGNNSTHSATINCASMRKCASRGLVSPGGCQTVDSGTNELQETRVFGAIVLCLEVVADLTEPVT